MKLQALFLAAGIAFSQAAYAQPKVTYLVDAAADAGVRALTIKDAGFGAELARIPQNPARLSSLEGMEPYLMVVRNDSTQNISRIGVRLDLIFPDRSPVVWVHTLTTAGPDGIKRLPPGTSLLAFPVIGSAGPDYASADPQRFASHLSLLNQASEVIVALDAVILDSGVILGPDQNGISSYYAAEQEAIRDMLRGVQRQQSEPDPETSLRDYMQRLAAFNPVPEKSLPIQERLRDRQFHYGQKQKSLASCVIYRGFRAADAIAYLKSAEESMPDLTASARQ